MYKEVRKADDTITPDVVKRESDGVHIPADPGNRDYREYLEWKQAGGKLTPADPVPVRPGQQQKILLQQLAAKLEADPTILERIK